MLTWVFFRATTFAKAWQMLESMFGFASQGQPLLTTLALLKVAVVVTGMVIVHWLMRNSQVLLLAYRLAGWRLSLAWSAILLLLIWAQESGSSFIYFQF